MIHLTKDKLKDMDIRPGNFLFLCFTLRANTANLNHDKKSLDISKNFLMEMCTYLGNMWPFTVGYTRLSKVMALLRATAKNE